MRPDDPKFLARRLLSVEVAWPDTGVDFPFRPPRETTHRLAELLNRRLADVVFTTHDKAVSVRFKENPSQLARDFESLNQMLRLLRTTDLVDRSGLRRGEGLLDTLIEGVRRDEQAARSELSPESLSRLKEADNLGLFPVELTSVTANSQFHSYLRLRCAGDALETMRDGARH